MLTDDSNSNKLLLNISIILDQQYCQNTNRKTKLDELFTVYRMLNGMSNE